MEKEELGDIYRYKNVWWVREEGEWETKEEEKKGVTEHRNLI